MTTGPKRWTSASLIPPLKGCALLFLYTEGVVFVLVCASKILDSASVGRKKPEVGSFGEQQSNWKNIAMGFVLVYNTIAYCITTIDNAVHVLKVCLKATVRVETIRVTFSYNQRWLIIYKRCFPWVVLLLRRLVGTWGNSAGSLTPAELDESAEITALQGMLATCTTAGHISQARFNKAMQERERERERCAHPEEKQMVVIQAWLRTQCKIK